MQGHFVQVFCTGTAGILLPAVVTSQVGEIASQEFIHIKNLTCSKPVLRRAETTESILIPVASRKTHVNISGNL